MPKLRPDPRDPRNPDYGEFKVEGPSSLSLRCEECGHEETWTADRDPLDKRDEVFIRCGLMSVARRDGWKIHVQAILCPRHHLDHVISRNFIPENLTDDPDYEDLSRT